MFYATVSVNFFTNFLLHKLFEKYGLPVTSIQAHKLYCIFYEGIFSGVAHTFIYKLQFNKFLFEFIQNECALMTFALTATPDVFRKCTTEN